MLLCELSWDRRGSCSRLVQELVHPCTVLRLPLKSSFRADIPCPLIGDDSRLRSVLGYHIDGRKQSCPLSFLDWLVERMCSREYNNYVRGV
jgi:hypothetical protein